MKTNELPICACGATMGLSVRGNLCRCTDCLWDYIENLRDRKDKMQETLEWVEKKFDGASVWELRRKAREGLGKR